MYLFSLLLLFSAILFAEEGGLLLTLHEGESSYTVHTPSTPTLSSKLIFPLHFYSIGTQYSTQLSDCTLSIGGALLLHSPIEKGEDYDWKEQRLTVYSHSNNQVAHYQEFYLLLQKPYTTSLQWRTKLHYQKIDTHWSQTQQTDYIKEEERTINKETLHFQQHLYSLYFGVDYTKILSSKTTYTISPSLVYSYITTKDSHLLRGFYTQQAFGTLGYHIEAQIQYHFNPSSTCKFTLKHTKLTKDSTPMDYYNRFDEQYLSYPSSYHYKQTTLTLSYLYSF